MYNEKLSILGKEYNLIYKENIEQSGFADWTVGEIVVQKTEKTKDSYGDLASFEQSVLRHEIIHAFLDESGLMSASDWARNEEMVDWFALQWHKIHQVVVVAEKMIKNLQEKNKEVK